MLGQYRKLTDDLPQVTNSQLRVTKAQKFCRYDLKCIFFDSNEHHGSGTSFKPHYTHVLSQLKWPCCDAW